MKLQFEVVFKQGTKEVGKVKGREDVIEATGQGSETRLGNMSGVEVAQQILQAEQLLEKLTGLRVHINQIQ